ncbi:MAG: valine--tRNA ligase [Elusimicrobia bacterium GWA2_69_24]|nr:MAG: valine--tRNA ligase [Elusimicrobia bacterium GWA2_69_24]
MLDKIYSPQAIEAKWTEAWAKAGLFHSEPARDGRRAYTIVIPPPNVTGALHIGHALNNTLQDVLVRFHRLHGRESCWVPGTDHGGIATQNVMEKQLKAENQTRHLIGRERFLERMLAWTRDCKKTILGQLTRLGCSLDFGREAFTLDEARARSVYHAFADFFAKGLISRGERMVNWCVRCGTALSDIEVEHEERKGHLWHIRYPLADDPAHFVTVATTRPETLLGDTAVAVHPEDERYEGLVGRKLLLPLHDRPIPLLADDAIDRAFGTGAVKVTPCHDPADFELWQRHLSEMEAPPAVIGADGKMTPDAREPYAGLSREKAREQVVKDLQAAKGRDGLPLLSKIEPYHGSVGVCYRCQQAIEPRVSEQWFMKMGPLAEKAVAAVDRREHRIFPDSWEKPYREWLGNIQDWCLSRQIWWGHRIPVWYCAGCLGDKLAASVPDGEGLPRKTGRVSALLAAGVPFAKLEQDGVWQYQAGKTPDRDGLAVQSGRPGPCPKCGGTHWLQDQDVLDTWFSSALWPLSVFGWPEETADLKFYYPTDVLVTGYEILYLWVARMQMMGLHFRGQVPFTHTLIHGIVRDKRGKKMSKSLGNVVDPLVLMDKFGTDAFRFSLATQAYPGRDIPFAEESVTGARNFANKLWNSTRFVLMNLEGQGGIVPLEKLDRAQLSLADRWILSEFEAVLAETRAYVAAYNLAAAAGALYRFLWDSFCDWYVELAKLERGVTVRSILVHVLTGTLKMLHPFMPFITEELFAALRVHAGESAEFILGARAPQLSGWADGEARRRMGVVMEAVQSLRALRSQLNVHPGLMIRAFYAGAGPEAEVVREHGDYLRHLAKLESLEPLAGPRPAQSATAVAKTLTFFVPLAGVIDFDKERQRIAKEIARLSAELEHSGRQLQDRNFVERAPEAEVLKVRALRQEAEAKHASLAQTLQTLEAKEGAPGGAA